MLALADALLMVLGAYLAIGTCVAAAFIAWGVPAIDPAGKGMPVSARLIILPGAAALWPVLLLRWLRRQLQPSA